MEGFDLPMSFGKKAKVQQNNLKSKLAQTQRKEAAPKEDPLAAIAKAGPSSSEVKEDEEIGPAPPKRKAEDEDSDSDDDLEPEVDRTPITHEIMLKDHSKLVSAIALDPSGARVATGGHDYDCKLWDFGGMDGRLRPFKSFEPNGSYFIHDLSYSPDGQQLLVISGTFYPKVFTREGEDPLEYAKGDVYIRDMKVTKGHIAEINSGKWHPLDNMLFLTAANDSTLRIWDVTNREKQKNVIVVRSKERGNKTHVTACAWSPDGKLIAGGCTDGSLHIWRTSSNLARPDQSNDAAHAKGNEMTCVAFSPDSKRLVTRSLDNTIKLWEARSLRKPLAVAEGIDSRYSETEVTWSPDGKYILTGTTVDPRDPEATGEILFLSPEDLSILRRVPIAKGASVVRIQWQSRINQIFASLSNGVVHVLYSPYASVHGALLPLARMPKNRARDIAYTTADLRPVIMTPEGESIDGQKYGESLHQKEKKSKKFKPTEPLQGAGRGGRIGASATASFVQEIFTDRVGLEDPREALLKYAREEDKEKAKYLADTPAPGRDEVEKAREK